MKRVLLTFAAAAVLAAGVPLAAPAAAATQVMPQVLSKMEAAGRSLKTLQAGITQVKDDRTLGIKEQSSGTFLYKAGAPGTERVLLQYTEPSVQTVSVIGEKVMMYRPDLKQVVMTTRKAGAGKNKSLNFLGLGYGEAAAQLREKYDVTFLGDDKVNGLQTSMIQLDPKDKSEGVQGIIVWVDQSTWLPVQYYVQEKGARTTITLTAMKPNLDIKDDRFVISYPKDTQVVQG
jgi:outer membrane lipoprotein-sorting protein